MACAQHICNDLIQRYVHHPDMQIFILFLVQLNQSRSGFKVLSGLCTSWLCAHIDELRLPTSSLPLLTKYAMKPISSIFDEELIKQDGGVMEAIALIKGCLQVCVREVNDVKKMSTEEVTIMIKILTALLNTEEGEKIIHYGYSNSQDFRGGGGGLLTKHNSFRNCFKLL